MKGVVSFICLVTLASVILADKDPHFPAKGEDWTPDSLINPEEILRRAVAEGDILGGNLVPGRDGLIRKKNRWPGGTVPYMFDHKFPEDRKGTVKRAMDLLSDKSKNCVTFVEHTNQTKYIRIQSTLDNCYARMGKQAKRKAHYINLPQWCLDQFGSTLHILMHALGFYHAHKHPDQARKVNIIKENIRCKLDKYFLSFNRNDTPNIKESYDYDSIMHFSAYAFTNANHQKTIVPTDPNVVIGQRKGLSKQDVKILRKLYKC